MESPSLTTEFVSAAKALIDERDRLQSELAYYKSAVDVLQLQNKWYAERLKTDNFSLDDRLPSEKTPDVHWVAGNFLYQPSIDHYLKDSVDAYQDNSAQRAMALLSLKINTGNLMDAQRVNAQLLLTAILRASGTTRDSEELMQRALALADDALLIAEEMEDCTWVCKAHFHRGLCYLHLNRWADARWSFVLASGADGYSELAELQREHVDIIIDGSTPQSTRMHLQSFLTANSDR